MDDQEHLLDIIGLDKEDSKVYMAILRNGRLSMAELVSFTRLKRTSIYRFVDDLIKRGLVVRNIYGKRTFYSAENPQKILRQIEKKKQEFSKILPMLVDLHDNSFNKPHVSIYENKQGLWNIYKKIGESFADVYAFVSIEKFFSVFSKKDMQKVKSLLTEGEKNSFDLVERDKSGKKYVLDIGKEKNKLEKAKLLPKDFHLDVDILVFGKSVAMISFDSLMGVIIENNHIANFHREVHKAFWK